MNKLAKSITSDISGIKRISERKSLNRDVRGAMYDNFTSRNWIRRRCLQKDKKVC